MPQKNPFSNLRVFLWKAYSIAYGSVFMRLQLNTGKICMTFGLMTFGLMGCLKGKMLSVFY